MGFNQALFARMPSAKVGHSLFKRPHCHASTAMHGDAVPVYCKLVSPGEVISEHMYGNIRMSTPIAPVYSSIKVSYNAFFCPLRLLWDHYPEFMGENKTGAGPQTGVFKIPLRSFNGSIIDKVKVHTPSHYMGKPLYKGSTIDNSAYSQKASVLKERAYWTIINEWYRHEQVQAPIIIDKGDSAAIATKNGVAINFSSPCQKVLKDFDYFTTCTRYPQYTANGVTLPLGSVAPIIGSSSVHDLGSDGVKFYAPISGGLSNHADLLAINEVTGQTAAVPGAMDYTLMTQVSKTNLVADLSSATAATIDQLYLSMAAQAWYYNANYGSRYFEMLEVHYGVKNPDLVLQRPEHIGEAKRFINVQQVLSTAGAATDSTTKLGQPGANSSTNIDVKFPRHSFGEWGYFIIIQSTYHERYYTAGIQREDLYEDMFDFFFPEFSNIGDMGVLRRELFAASSLDPAALWAFQESWSEMRYTSNRVSGLFDPYVSSDNSITGHNNPLKGWVLTEKWNNAPSFGEQFLLEDCNAIKDALVSGENGPDYIFYLYFDEKTLNEVPVYSRPGLPGRGRGLL